MGNLDFLSGIDASYKDEILSKEGELNSKYEKKIKLFTQNYLNTEYLGFYSKDSLSPVKNLKIRQAINYGFDRKKMLKFLRNNIGTPAINGFVPRGMPSFNDKLILKYCKMILQIKEIIHHRNGREIHYPEVEFEGVVSLLTSFSASVIV